MNTLPQRAHIAPALPAGINDRLQRMMARPQVEMWQPVPDEQLGGIIIGSRMEQNPYNQSQQQAIVRTPEGRVVAVWLSAWMLGQFKAKEAEKGDLVVFSYLGKRQSQRGTVYGQYTIEIEKVAA